MKFLNTVIPPPDDSDLKRAIRIFQLGEKMGKLLLRKRRGPKTQAAIDRNIAEAKQLGVTFP